MTKKLDDFTKSYLTCALWTSTDDNEESYLDNNFQIEDIAIDDLIKIKIQCENFQKNNVFLLQKAYEKVGYNASNAGHDLWLTRNGHGTGFWDRDLNDIGEQLSLKAKELNVSDIYKGDDEKLYLTNLPQDKNKVKLR